MSETTEIRVLHVDDDENVLTFSKQFLESFDPLMRVDMQMDPVKGVAQAVNGGYACVVTDYQMPTMDGLVFAQKIIGSTNIPVILYTGRGSEEVAEKAYNVGISDYIRKEVDPSHYQILAKRIRGVVENRRLRNLYESIAERSMDGISIKEGTKILYVNPALVKLTGCESATELIGHNFLEWMPEEDRAEMERITLLRQQGANLPPFYEYTIQRRDGTKIRCEATSNLIDYHGKTVILTEVRDLTERKRMEERLKRSETKYRHLFENMINGYTYLRLLIDHEGNPIDAVFLEINPAFEKITGLERDAVVGKKYSDLFLMTVRDRKMFSNVFGPVATKGGVKNLENYWPTLDKWLRLQVYTSERGYCSVLFEDVTKQREERERREVEQKRAMDEVSALLYASRNIQRNASFRESAKAIFESCKTLVGAKTGQVMIISHDNQVEVALNEAGLMPEYVGQIPPSKLLEKVIKGGSTIIENSSERIAAEPMPPTKKRKKNALLSPLKHEGETIGILVLSDKGSDFDERDKRLASAFAELISLALMNERYQANLKTLRGELNSTIKERESQVQNLNELFNGISSAVIVGQRTKIVCANNSAGNILGLTPKELIGTDLSAYKLAGQHKAISNDLVKGEKVELLKANGNKISVTVTTGRTNWNSKPAIIYLFNE